MNLSLRNQLALWLGLIVLVLMFSTTLMAQQVIVWNMESNIDEALQKRANMVAAIISSDITTDEASYVRVMSELTKQEFTFVPLLLRIMSPKGNTIIQFGQVAGPIVQSLDQQLKFPDAATGRLDSITLPGIEPLRVYSVAVSHPRTGEALAEVQVVEALGQVNQARNRLWLNGVIVGLVGGLLAVSSGMILFQRGFRPMRSILKAIDDVDYTHLKARLQEETRPAELEQLAKSLMAMWQRLDLAVSAKEKVIGNMSHDLRTPLTALQGHLEVLLLQPSLNPEVRDSLERMLKETRRLVRMVKNLLLSVQLEANPPLLLEEVNLKELVDEVVGDMWVLGNGLEFAVAAPEDIRVRGDRDLLKQLTINIVDNAIKFTPKGGQIKLTLGREPGWALLGVNDTGRGIPADQLPHVTEAFYKAEKSPRPEGEGARLGLSIVKQVAELHKGSLRIQSREGGGTSVMVRLPAGP